MNGWQRLYFLGIGGIGMSALARYFAERGVAVSGYDRTETEVSRGLVADGIPVYYSADLSRLAGADAVIYTPAVPADFPERVEAERLGLPMYKRAQVLGLISQNKRTIAIAGTHGKTTTSALVAHLLRSGGVDCTAFVGGLMANYKTNYLSGKSDIVVVEADEFDRSFLQLYPETAVLTSLDPDHLDIYGEPAAMRQTYGQFISQVKAGGHLYFAAGLDLPDTVSANVTVRSYGIEKEQQSAHQTSQSVAVLEAETHAEDTLSSHFSFRNADGLTIDNLRLPMPGLHNVRNAVAAISVALQYGVSPEAIRQGLGSFKGIWRRFEVQYHSPTLTYIDDYAHHPTELNAAISATRKLFPDRQLTVVFQPHLFSRTRDFWQEFAHELNAADVAHIVHIYPARELSIPGITSNLIFQQTSAAIKRLLTLNQVPEAVRETTQKPAVVLTLGAGDIDTQVQPVLDVIKNLDKHQNPKV